VTLSAVLAKTMSGPGPVVTVSGLKSVSTVWPGSRK
jgi:hypothetical protein